MIKKIEEIENALTKVENTVKTLHTERDDAKREAETLRKQLDERELEVLQLDEDLRNATERYEGEIATLQEKCRTLETKLDAFSERIRALVSLLPELEDAGEKSS